MIRSGRSIAALALAVLLVFATAAAAPAPYRPPVPQVRRLANGLTIAVFPDHRLPIAQIAVLVPGGSMQEGAEELGVAALTASLLTQGSASRTAGEFETELVHRAITMNGNAGREYATISAGCRVEDFEAAMGLLAEAVLTPVFPEDEIDAARVRQVQQLPITRQNAGGVADEHAFALAFPGQTAGYPTGGTMTTLNEIHRSEVQEFHRRCYRPDRALIAIAGDVDTAKVFPLVTELFAPWRGTAPGAETPKFATGTRPHVRIVDVPGRGLSEFRVLLPAPGRESPDAVTTQLVAALLETHVRGRAPVEERASVNALTGGGVLVVSGSAPSDSIPARLRGVRAALAAVSTQPPPADLLAAARRRLADGYALQFETLGGVINQWLSARAAGLPDDAPATRADRWLAVTPEDIARVARASAGAPAPVIVVVGPAAKLKAPLAAIGTVEVVDVASSPVAVPMSPSRARAAPTPEQTADGKRLIADAVKAHGGVERLRGIHDSVLEAQAIMMLNDQEVTGTLKESRKDPARYLASMVVRTAYGLQGLQGNDKGWVIASSIGDTAIAADSLTLASLRTAFSSDLVHVLRSAQDPASRVAARGRERVGAGEVDVVEVVAADGRRRVLFFDGASHRLVAIEQSEAGTDVPVRRSWSDFRPVKGVLWPFAETRTLRGQRLMTLQIRSVQLNVGVADAAFAPPSRGSQAVAPRIRR
jgi:zinc protease